jgi:hypothetical protein
MAPRPMEDGEVDQAYNENHESTAMEPVAKRQQSKEKKGSSHVQTSRGNQATTPPRKEMPRLMQQGRISVTYPNATFGGQVNPAVERADVALYSIPWTCCVLGKACFCDMYG